MGRGVTQQYFFSATKVERIEHTISQMISFDGSRDYSFRLPYESLIPNRTITLSGYVFKGRTERPD